MSFVEHWACPEHPRQENVYYTMDDPTGWRCNVCGGEAVKAEVVPADQLAGAVDPETLERHRWALDAAVRFITENGGNPDVVKSLLVLAEWGQ